MKGLFWNGLLHLAHNETILALLFFFRIDLTAFLASTGAQASSEQDLEQRRTELRCDRYIQRLIFSYGELPTSDPLHQYVRETLALGLGATEANKFRILILPELQEVNAFALANHTIVLSGALLRFIEYREELMAVLLHEAVHIQRRHSELKKTIGNQMEDPDIGTTLKSILRSIGIGRLFEHEADARWVLEQMKNTHVNPYGEVKLLERFHEEEKRRNKGPSLTHGSSMDRSILLEGLFLHVPLDALSKDLTPMPAALKASVPQQIAFPRNSMVVGPIFAGGDGAEEEEERRRDMLSKLPPDRIPFALEGIFQNISELQEYDRRNSRKTDITGHRKAAKLLLDRVDADVFHGQTKEDSGSIARGLYLQLFARIPYFFASDFPSTALNKRKAADCPTSPSPEWFEQMIAVLSSGQLDGIEAPIVVGPSKRFLEGIIEAYMETLKLDESSLPETVDKVVDFSFRFVTALIAFYERKGVAMESRNDIFKFQIKMLMGKLAKSLTLRSRARETAAKLVPAFTDDTMLDNAEAAVLADAIAQEIPRRVKPVKFDSGRYQDLIDRMDDHFRERPLSEIMPFFRFMMTGIDIYSDTFFDETRGIVIVNPASVHAGKWIVLRLAESVISHHPEFKTLDPDLRYLYQLDLADLVVRFDTRKAGVKGPLEQNGQLRLLYPQTVFSLDEGGVQKLRMRRRERYALHEDDLPYLQQAYFDRPETWVAKERSRDQLLEFYSHQAGRSIESPSSRVWQFALITFLRRRMAAETSAQKKWDRFFIEIEAFEKAGVPIWEMMSKYPETFGPPLAELFNLLPNDPSERQVKQISRLRAVIRNPTVKHQLGLFVISRIWPSDFNGRLDLIFERDEAGRRLDLNRFNEFIESDMETHEQYLAVKSKVQTEIDAFLTEGPAALGVAAILSNVKLSTDQTQEFMLALLESGTKDERLKRFFYRTIVKWQRIFNPYSEEGTGTDDELSKAFDESDEQGAAAIQTITDTADRAISWLYGMDGMARAAVVKHLLIGRGGLLVSDADVRTRFLKAMVELTVDKKADPDFYDTILEVCAGLGKATKWKPLYFALQGLLSERIGIAPEKTFPWLSIVYAEDGRRFRNKENINRFETDVRTLASMESDPRRNGTELWRHTDFHYNLATERLRRFLQKSGTVQSAKESAKLAPVDFSLNLVEKTGSLGVRFLQVLPQFVELKRQLLERLSRVYDGMTGQSKYAAITVLESKWPNFWDEIERVGKRLGGGSLMTVYRLHTKKNSRWGGRTLVVKVLNPNVAYILKNNKELVKEVLKDLIKTNPVKYGFAERAVDEVVEWIEKDISIKNFLTQDAKFRANEGFTAPGLNAAIHVPESFEPSNAYFIVEEEIQGENLTQWDALVAAGADMKSAVSVIARNFLSQLGRRLVHSDAHVGNFRVAVSPDGKSTVSLLDRNYLLDLSEGVGKEGEKKDVRKVLDPITDMFQFLSTDASAFVDKLAEGAKTPLKKKDRDALVAAWRRQQSAVAAGRFSLPDFKADVRQFNLLVPEAANLIDYLLDPAHVLLQGQNVEPFVQKLLQILNVSAAPDQEAQLIAQWRSVLEDIQQKKFQSVVKFARGLIALPGISPANKTFFQPLLRYLEFSFEPPERFVDELLTLSKQPVPPANRTVIVKAWKTAREQILNGKWEGLNTLIVAIRKNNVELPLELTLILKNINAIHQMSVKAGFAYGFIGALAYSGEQEPPKVKGRARKPPAPAKPKPAAKRRKLNVAQSHHDTIAARLQDPNRGATIGDRALWIITHPLAAPFIETFFLNLGLQTVAFLLGPGVVTLFIVGFVFAVSHDDVYDPGNTWADVAYLVAARTLGGTILTWFLLLPNGVAWSAAIHMILNIAALLSERHDRLSEWLLSFSVAGGSRRSMALKIIDAAAPMPKVFARNAGDGLSWQVIDAALRAEIRRRAADGRFDSANDRARMADLLALLDGVLTQREALHFSEDLGSYLSRNIGGDEIVLALLEKEGTAAREQVKSMVNALPKEGRRTLAVAIPSEKATTLAALREDASIEAALNAGRLVLTSRTPEQRLSDLLRTVDAEIVRRGSPSMIDTATLRFLMSEGETLPDGFFDLSENDRRRLIINILLRTLPGVIVELPGSSAAALALYRQRLIAA